MRRSLAVLVTTGSVLGGVALGATAFGPQFAGADTTTPTTAAASPRPGQAARIERATAHLRGVLQPLVDGGTLTQEQADAVIASLTEARSSMGGRLNGRGGHWMPGGPGGPGGRGGFERLAASRDAVAEALGMEPAELAEALRGGTSIAELARQKGIEVGAVVDALVASAAAHIDEAVAADKLSAEQAEKLKEGLASRIAKLVERTRPVGGRGPR